MYVLDGQGRPVPPGVAGELYIGGDGVTRGYPGSPDRTAARFVPDPFDASGQGRLYRTGDVVFFPFDGNLGLRRSRGPNRRGTSRLSGRAGWNRGDSGEHPAVRQCAVVMTRDRNVERLTAYVAAHREQPAADDLGGTSPPVWRLTRCRRPS